MPGWSGHRFCSTRSLICWPHISLTNRRVPCILLRKFVGQRSQNGGLNMLRRRFSLSKCHKNINLNIQQNLNTRGLRQKGSTMRGASCAIQTTRTTVTNLCWPQSLTRSWRFLDFCKFWCYTVRSGHPTTVHDIRTKVEMPKWQNDVATD